MNSSKVIITNSREAIKEYSFEDDVGLSSYDLALISIDKIIKKGKKIINKNKKITYLIWLVLQVEN